MKRSTIVTISCLLLVAVPLSAQAQDVMENMARRLQVLEDREAIRNLLLDYGRHLDARDWDAFATLFVADEGTWNGGMGIARGHEEIRSMMVNSIGSDNKGQGSSAVANLHWLGNEYIDVDGDSATALSKWIFFMTGTDGGPDAVFIGHYSDKLVRDGSQWRFRERVVHGDIMRPVTISDLNSGNTP